MGDFSIGDLFLFPLAGFLSLVAAWTLLKMYRQYVVQQIRSRGKALEQESGTVPLSQRHAPATKRIAAGTRTARAEVDQRRRAAARIIACAGGVYAVLAGIAMLSIFETRSILIAAAGTCVFLLPGLIGVDLLLEGRHRTRHVVLYVGLVATLSLVMALGAKPDGPSTPIPSFMWMPFLIVALHGMSLITLLPVLIRTTRTIGTVMLGVFIVALLGFRLSLRDPLSALQLLDTTLVQVFGDAAFGSAGFVFAIVSLAVWLGLALTAAWIAGHLYESRYVSDQSIAIDTLFLVCALPLVLHGYLAAGHVRMMALLPFIAFVVVASMGRRTMRTQAGGGVSVLLVRAFQPRTPARHVRVFRQFQADWRRIGVVRILAGPDLATETVDPFRFLRFLTGRFTFIETSADLLDAYKRLAMAPTTDGRFRISELACAGSIWRDAVALYVAHSDVILVDVSSLEEKRGAKQARPGLVEEIHFIVKSGYLDRSIFLTGSVETQAALECEVKKAAGDDAGDPGALSRVPGYRTVSIEGSVVDAVDRVLAAITLPAEVAEDGRSTPRPMLGDRL